MRVFRHILYAIGSICFLMLFVALLFSGCGGGGGGGGNAGSSATPPYIRASLISFATGAIPSGIVEPGSNSVASVEVLSDFGGSPISDASVIINGVSLPYVSANQDYERAMNVAPGDNISLTVTVSGRTYTASGNQFTSYPAIISPVAGAQWWNIYSNLAAWSAGAPTTDSFYALGVFSWDGQLIWPQGNSALELPSTTTSFIIDPGNLSVGNRIVMVGLATAVDISGASVDSAIVIGGFNCVPIWVTEYSPASVESITVGAFSPIVATGQTRQLTATGRYPDNEHLDLTTMATWTSSDTTKATVNSSGLVTGVGSGYVTITATVGDISGSKEIYAFRPTPSPPLPLSQSVTYQIDYAHSGHAVFSGSLSFPVNPTWSVTLNGAIFYPLIVDGKVFVTTDGPLPGGAQYGSTLYALDKQTGQIIWGPITVPQTYYPDPWSGIAYDNGKIFVISGEGLLSSFDAATGQAGWNTHLDQSSYTAAPTAVNGIVYVGGAGSGGTLYAVDESNGHILWTNPVANGDISSPTVSNDGVFVNYPCQIYKFDPLTGALLWHNDGPCSGGGGYTAAYYNGLLYTRYSVVDVTVTPQNWIFDAATGIHVGNFPANRFISTPIPAFATQTGFFLDATKTMNAIDLSSRAVLWSFRGDGGLVSAPIVINQTVIVGSSSGLVFAVDATTGSEIWRGNAGASIVIPTERMGMGGFGAGEGYLVVPAGNVLTAWCLSGP